MSTVRVLAPEDQDISLDELLTRMARSMAEVPFAQSRVEYCVELSRALFSDREARGYPELQALGFWLRKAEVVSLRTEFEAFARPDVRRVARGMVFHVPPGNVDTIFIYSWTLALLTGNSSVVRISERNPPQTQVLCRLLRDVLAGRESGQFFVQYGHDAEVTAELSRRCDVRVIWGGDETVRTIRTFPLGVHAKELAFPDRYSLSGISAAKWLAASTEVQSNVLRDFYNDTFWFDQMACSSPRVVVWCGEAAAGNIFLPHPLYAPWVNDFIEECAAFPNGAHDDQVDAMTQALLRWNMVPRETVVCYYNDSYQISPI